MVSERGKQERQCELEGQEKNCEGGKGREIGKAKVSRKVSEEIRSGIPICWASGEVHVVSVPVEVGSKPTTGGQTKPSTYFHHPRHR